jgi:hypothetical protein
MLEYELYLPLHHNDGRPIDPEKLKDLKKRLVDEFGGLTHFRQENEGLWKIGEHTFRDRVEIVRVLASNEASAQKYFAKLKADLTRDLNQQDFLIVSRQVTAL